MSMKKHPVNNDENNLLFGDEFLRETWELSGKFREKEVVSENEIDEAWANIAEKIDDRENSSAYVHVLASEKFWIRAKYVVAAVALIVLGAYLFLIPKTVTVPYGEMVTVDLPDGSVMELNSGSTVSYHRFFWGDERSVTLNGEAYFSVEQAEKPFRVESNGAVTEVLGTQFNIRSWGDELGTETSLTVSEGEVEFYSAERPVDPVRVSAGQISRWNPERVTPVSPDSISLDDVTAWRENRLVFRNRPLITILNDLERRFDARIELEATELATETLTAYYREPQDLSAILDDISMVKGLQYSETANGYRMFKQ